MPELVCDYVEPGIGSQDAAGAAEQVAFEERTNRSRYMTMTGRANKVISHSGP